MSKTEEQAAANLAFSGSFSLAEALDYLRTQRAIGQTMAEIVRSGPLQDTASVIPQKASLAEPPAKRGSGFATEAPLEPPLGEAALRRLDEITDAMIGPAVRKPKK